MNPQSFGKYSVVQPLGRGGMASVYEARDALLNRRVAIKVIHPHLAEDPNFTNRFLREARLVAGLRHPQIVNLYDYDVLNGQPYMVMEYLEGGTLKAKLDKLHSRTRRMQLETANQLLLLLAAALDYAHHHQAIHRDIKPANILFTAQGEPVITDFGIAKLLHESLQISETGGIIGTPAYMSPEQASGATVDGRSDQYSLAVVAYEMICGRVPFTSDSPTAILMQHISAPPPPPRALNPNLSEALQDVILKALSKHPDDRYASILEFAQAFDGALRSGSSLACGSSVADASLDAATQVGDTGQPAVLPWQATVKSTQDSISSPNSPATSIATATPVPSPVEAAASEAGHATPVRQGLPSPRKRWSAFWLVGLAGLILIGVSAVFFIVVPWVSETLSSRVAELPTGQQAEFTLAVADFDGSQASKKIDFARRIFDQLESELIDLEGDVRVIRTNEVYADATQAADAGQKAQASLLIWGWYDDAGVSPHIQVIQPASYDSPEFASNIFFNSAQAAGLDQAGLQEIDLTDFFSYLRVPRLVSELDFFLQSGAQQIAFLSETVLGMAYQLQGDFDPALLLYDKALQNAGDASAAAVGEAPNDFPGVDLVYLQRGTLLSHLQRIPEAVSDLEKAAQLNPELAESFYNLGVLYPELCTPAKQLQAARASAERAAVLRPDDADVHRLLASLYGQSGQYQQAQLAAQTALEIDPQNASAYLLLGDLYKAGGDLQKAQEAWQAGISLLEDQVDRQQTAELSLYISLGDAYLQAGKPEEARQVYEIAQSLSPENPEIQRGLGGVALNQGRLEEAQEYYREWVALSPNNPAAHTALGLAYAKHNKNDLAVEALNKAASLSACNTNAHLLLGSFYWNLGDYPDAETGFQQAVTIEPVNTSSLYLLGVSQLFQGKYPDAVASFTRALELDPTMSEARRALATTYGEQQTYDKALPEWQNLADALPDDPTAWISLADTYEKLGEMEKALSAYQQALALGEDANIHVYIGIVHFMQDDLDQAAMQFQKAIEVDPLSALGYSALGEVAMKKGDLEGAAQAFSRSLELEESPALRSQLASLYARLRKPHDAVQQAEKALQGDPNNPQTINQLAGLYSSIGRLDDAEVQYRNLLALDANRPDAHAGLAGIAYKRCDLDTMVEEYEQAAALGQNLVYFQALPALAYGAQGKIEQQAQAYFSLSQNFPNDPLMHLFLGEYAWQKKDIQVAHSEFQAALQSDELPPVLQSLAQQNLGALAYANGDLEKAEQEFRLALQYFSANVGAQMALGDISLRENDPASALQAYDLALSLLPEYAYSFSADNAVLLEPVLWARRGLAFSRLDQAEQSELAFQQARALSQALLETTPQWAQARFIVGSVYFLLQEDNRADAEFIQAMVCDSALETAIQQAKIDLAWLR